MRSEVTFAITIIANSVLRALQLALTSVRVENCPVIVVSPAAAAAAAAGATPQ